MVMMQPDRGGSEAWDAARQSRPDAVHAEKPITPTSLNAAAPKEIGIFPIGLNINCLLISVEGHPEVVLRNGSIVLEKYPLRNLSVSLKDQDKPRTFRTDLASVSVDWCGISVEIEVKEPGIRGWLPGNANSWLAFDRDLRNPDEITVVEPGFRQTINNDRKTAA